LIKAISKSFALSLVISLVVLVVFLVLWQDFSGLTIAKTMSIVFFGILLNRLCYRFGILGKESHLPLLLFTLLSVIIIPTLTIKGMVYILIWLIILFLAFERGDDKTKSLNSMIYLGIVLGVAQTIENTSVLLLLPTYFLFSQTGTFRSREVLISTFYFLLVITGFLGILYVMELEDKMINIVPAINLDYGVLNTIVIRVFIPYVAVLLLVHFLNLGSYRFRYPNKMRFLNQSMLWQLLLGVLIVFVTSLELYLSYILLPAAVLLSYAFTYKRKMIVVDAGFVVLMLLAICSLWMQKFLIL
jgi:hypothetical protein